MCCPRDALSEFTEVNFIDARPGTRRIRLECEEYYPSINLLVNTAKAGLKFFIWISRRRSARSGNSAVPFVRDRSDVDDLIGVLAEIPARAVTKMRKQGVDAGIDFLLTGLILNFPIFYVDCVKRVDRDLPKLRPTARDLEPKRNVVAQVKQRKQSHD